MFDIMGLLMGYNWINTTAGTLDLSLAVSAAPLQVLWI